MNTVPFSNAHFRRRRLAGIGIAFFATLVSSAAVATGWAPFVREDFAEVVRGGSVSTLLDGATSVLANDWDFERDPMIAVLTRTPKHGELVLNDDGTFVYQHDGSNSDKDEFKYRAFDGTSYSKEAAVKIEVLQAPNSPPFTIGSPGDQEALEGQFYQLDLSPYFGDTDEEDALTFSAGGLPGRRLDIGEDSGVLSGTPGSSDARDEPYTVTITARDRAGASASLEFLLTIFPDDRADLKVTAALAANPVAVGESIRWNIDVENLGAKALDTGELRAQWNTSGPALSLTIPAGCSASGNNSQSPTMTCNLSGLDGRAVVSFAVDGTQGDDGDHSLLAIAVSEDPSPDNNSVLQGGQVVAAFSEGPTQTVSVAAVSLAGADFDNDGLYDIVVTTDGDTSVYFNSGNRSLRTPGTSLGTGSGGSAVVALDWNGDGNKDIAVAGASNAVAKVWLNDGSSGVSQEIRITGANPGLVTAAGTGDFDLDGNDDLVVAGENDAYVFLSNGGSGYAQNALPGAGALDVAVSDLDNDSWPDIVMIDASDRAVRLLRNAGNGRDYSSQRLLRGSVASVAANDLNGDGDVDLLLAIDGDDLELPESKLLIQRSDGSFPAGTAIGASPLTKMMSGDIDADALPDIVTLNEAGVHQLYTGESGGGFSLSPEQIVSDGMQSALLIDFNNDQSLDLVMAGRIAGVLEIHANNGIGRLGLGDRAAPIIALNGLATVELPAGGEYIEEGATATDDIDGDVSDSVLISGTVNSAVIGTYTVNYSAFDRAGNKATTIRTVKVGVNEGTGGSGGGQVSPLFLYLLALLLSWLLVRRIQRQTSS